MRGDAVATAAVLPPLPVIRIVRETPRRAPEDRHKISSARDVQAFLAPILEPLDHEEMWALLLDTQRRVIGAQLVTRGTLDASLVHPRELLRAAIVASAHAVILVHNHPSGDATPSPEDRAVTRQLAAAAGVIWIPLLDHIIIGHARYFSFVEAGLLHPET